MSVLPLSRHISRRGSGLRDHFLDPQLDRRIKFESHSRSNTPTLPFHYNTAVDHHQAFQQMQPWVDSPFADLPMHIKQESPETSSEYSLFETLHARGISGHRDFSGAPSESLVSYLEDECNDHEPSHDALMPKGVQWPGMAMFDSATPEMKRKRNQKKSVNVVRQLQLTSEIIEPEELVFDSSGTLRKTRTITGEPDSSDSLIEGETEPEVDQVERKRPRRRAAVTRTALADKHVNTNRVTRTRAAVHRPLSAQSTSRGPYYDSLHDHDDDLTFGAHRPVSRSGISIHRDNSGPDITFNQPGFAYLTAPFRPSSRAARNQAARARNTATVPHAAHPRLPSWDRFDEHINDYHSSGDANGGALGSNTAPATMYESFGQFINLGNNHTSANNTANPFLGGGGVIANGQHGLPTLFPHLGGPSPSTLSFPMTTSDLFPMPQIGATNSDHLIDMFGFGPDLTAATTGPIINPLLGFPAATQHHDPTSANVCNNPLYQERHASAAAQAVMEGEEDEATISIASEN